VLKFSEKSDSRMVDRLCCNPGNLAREGQARRRGRRVSVIRGIKGRMLRGLFQEMMKEKSQLFLSVISMLMHQLVWRLKKMPWQWDKERRRRSKRLENLLRFPLSENVPEKNKGAIRKETSKKEMNHKARIGKIVNKAAKWEFWGRLWR
jgi:hypothetical protein